jgi:single-stranded-DNA-specific exonuclease
LIEPAPLSFSGARWTLSPQDPGARDALAAEVALHPTLAACLVARGHDAVSVRRFLGPGWGELNDPASMLGMDRAVERIRAAVAGGERVRIVSDYDVDGTTSALVLRATLELLGLRSGVDHHVPHRFGEGYGLSESAVAEAADAGVGLLIAADIGVRDHAAVALAVERGLDVIICDHHQVGEGGVPPATAVLCAGQPGCAYPNPALAACGVCFTLARALLADLPQRERLERSLLKVVALGTVADVVDLGTPENRAIVALGLEALSEGPHAPGLQALLTVAGCAGRPLSASDLGFRLGPRVNAAGRLAHAGVALELLQERDPRRARELAGELDRLNRRRQTMQESLVKGLLERSLPGGEGSPPRCAAFPVFAGPEEAGWHRGVVGIAAGKLREALQRPVAVAAIADGQATGSLRSVPGVDAVAALRSASGLLTRFGGHAAAAGFGLPAERVPELERALSGWLREAHSAEDLVPSLRADARVELEQLGELLALELERLEPCGKGNPKPRLLVPGVRIQGVRRVRQHLFFELGEAQGVWWSGAPHTRGLTAGPVDLLGSLGPDRREGFARPMFTVQDARPHWAGEG